jgi:DNA invertase Pin-like site-specific DNA recombinase
MNYFLYCRKSTDVEDKQVLSIEAQLSKLRDFAKRENLTIVETFIEKQSAKIPGRPIFNKMIEQIEKGRAQGIIAWHPDRLARNSVDGGKIIYLVDTGTIAALRFPTFWFEPTPQGKFMLNISFGQSKYSIRFRKTPKEGFAKKITRKHLPTGRQV